MAMVRLNEDSNTGWETDSRSWSGRVPAESVGQSMDSGQTNCGRTNPLR